MQSAQQKSEKKWDSNDMYRRFDTALEASKILDDLRSEIKKLNFNEDLRKFYNNCEVLMGQLGSAEVRARQLHKPYLADKARENLANAIDYLEKLLIIARLTQ